LIVYFVGAENFLPLFYARAGRRWINQMAVWDAMQSDTAMADSIPTLLAFKALAAHSRYKWLTDMAALIATNNYSGAQSLLSQGINAQSNTSVDDVTGLVMRDGSAANYVVQNYLDVYRYSIKYATDTLSADDISDVLALATLCPDNDGKVVFAARALYYNITGVVLEPDDNCSGSDNVDSRHLHNMHNPIKNINELSTGQSYSLQPNPNDGNLSITQKQADNSEVKIQVWNAVGKVVFTKKVAFTNGKADIHLQSNPSGLYLLQLSDANGNTFTRKFVIQ
jgi:hypothetical protein